VYGRADFAVGKLRGDFGLRVVRTEQTSDGFLGNASGGFSPTSVKNTYTDTLPNFNATYELSKEVLLRGAVART
ncbi:TonB-dependent receptor domain-containing protein, partial [Enterobacter hormaechei]